MSDLHSKGGVLAGDRHPAVWRILYSHSVSVRVQRDQSGDTEFSHRETQNGQFDVVALTEGLAQEAFLVDHPPTIYTRLTNPERVCYVDAVMHYGRYYGGHFS